MGKSWVLGQRILAAVALVVGALVGVARAQEPDRPVTIPSSALVPAQPVGQVEPTLADTGWLRTRWTTREGLPQNSVTDMVQTRDGYLWLSTFGGLARFDGRRFQIFDSTNTPVLGSNRFTRLHEDRAGDLWIGSHTGEVYRYAGGGFEQLRGDTGQAVWTIVEDGRGRLWFGGSDGLRQLDGTAAPLEEAGSLLERKDGTRWLANAYEVARWGDDGIEVLFRRDKIDHDRGFLLEGPDGNTAHFSQLEVRVLDPDGVLLAEAPIDLGWIHRGALAADGSWWVAAERGFGRLVYAEGEIAIDVLPDGRTGYRRSLCFDREGNLWLGTDGDGLLRLQTSPLLGQVTPTDAAGVLVGVSSLGEDGAGGIIALTLDKGGFQVGAAYDPTGYYETMRWARCTLADSAGRRWAGLYEGLGLFESGWSATPQVFEIPGHNRVHSLLEAPDGGLWIGGNDSLILRRDDNHTVHHAPGFGSILRLALGLDGTLWFLSRFGVGRLREGNAEDLGILEQLPGGAPRDLHISDDGTVWVTSYGGGLARLRDGEFTTYHRGHGLHDNGLSDILEDDQGRLWVNSNAGVQVMRRDDLDAFAAGERQTVPVRLLYTGEGSAGGHRTPDGRMWFNTIDGIVALDPGRYRINPHAPAVVLEGLRVDGLEVPLSERVVLPPGDGELELSYTGISLTAPDQVTYRYRLAGFDEVWREAGTRSLAIFTGVPHGTYRFEVLARNEDGVWSSEPASLDLVLEPHFTETLVFRFLVALGIALVLAGWHLRRTLVLRRHNAELARSDARHHAVLAGSMDPLVIADGAGTIRFVSDSVGEVFGRGVDLVGENLDRLIAAPGPGAEPPGRLDSRALEMVGRRADGSEFPCEVLRTETLVPDESAPLVTVVMRDLTERRQLERSLQESTRLETVGRLAGGIAHDFNNVLTAILTNATFLLKREAEGDEATREQLNEIRESAHRAAALTRQLLAFSRQQVLRPRVVDPCQVLRGLEPMLRRLIPEPVELNFHYDDDVGSVRVDPGQLEQVVMNLVLNARDAMPNGGTLTVETGSVMLDDKYAAEYPGARIGRHAMVAVTDTGSGIPEADMPRVFEPFFSTKGSAGTGLGLASSQGIVKQSGGHIVVYSELDQGSVFKVYLPVVDEAPDVLVPEPPAYEDVRGNETLVVCDDYAVARHSIERVLRGHGYRVLVAERPLRALELARELGSKLDLLITDVVMPEMNGVELAQGIRVQCPDLKVLYMSGYTTNVVVDRGTVKGGFELLEKPFTTGDLLQRVRRILDEGRGSGA